MPENSTSKVLITGGCGYIGVHTIVDMISNGYDVISIDNNSRSDERILKGVFEITKQNVKNYKIDLCEKEMVDEVFKENPDINSVIHFAAYKTVPESVADPLLYYYNNLNSLINVVDCSIEYEVNKFVFSSSCAVYGNVTDLPVTEETKFAEAESPYGSTKQIGEKILEDFSGSNINCISLRYFNPVGAHLSGLIGEVPYNNPDNLVPIIGLVAKGKLPQLIVHGSDYDTPDGTCVRDYIHVMDIAHAHTKAVNYLDKGENESAYEVFNLGSGKGTSVMEMIKAFEKNTGEKLNYSIGPRRDGDVAAIYANNSKAKEKLKWIPELSLDDIMVSSWKWQGRLEELGLEIEID
ncbi:MAG: UDP-glucose 4-epimerase GalE [Bacteroidetes bacterium]|nr:UDP-glucose 4-epimerase GalE [Bacteroidota bacterium]